MIDLRRHEQFEMDVLKKLSDDGLLRKLIFGGGTALRLCFGLNRYSIDLDFWTKKGFEKKTFEKMKKSLTENYEITDAHEKYFSYLLELRSPKFKKKLKIEIRKDQKKRETETNIAFSPYSTIQVQLTTFTLTQMGGNKIGFRKMETQGF